LCEPGQKGLRAHRQVTQVREPIEVEPVRAGDHEPRRARAAFELGREPGDGQLRPARLPIASTTSTASDTPRQTRTSARDTASAVSPRPPITNAAEGHSVRTASIASSTRLDCPGIVELMHTTFARC